MDKHTWLDKHIEAQGPALTALVAEAAEGDPGEENEQAVIAGYTQRTERHEKEHEMAGVITAHYARIGPNSEAGKAYRRALEELAAQEEDCPSRLAVRFALAMLTAR